MAHKYAQIVFTDAVRQVQTEQKSRVGYASMDGGPDYNHLLSQNEADFIAERDSFYMASVSETLWPYVQHRGGTKGFVRVLDASTIGFSDFSGNRQYVSTGNFRGNNRVALFFMDYPNRRRLKMMGRIRKVDDDDWETLAKLEVGGYRASIERAFIIKVEAFDWNCPQHITPRFTETEIQQMMMPLLEENKVLKAHQKTAKINNLYPSELGQGELPLIISGIRQLTPRIRAYELKHRDDITLPKVQAGAHLQIPVKQQTGEMDIRHYSICSNPARQDIYEIAVLREENGQGGSLAIHEHFHLGMLLRCQPPQNFFQLHDDARPAVLIAGGIGITPIKPMAQSLCSRGSKFSIHYAGRSLIEMAFRDRLQREFGEQLHLYTADKGERINLEQLIKEAPKDALFYACGPQSLIDQLISAASKHNISPDRIRFERFSPATVSDAKALTVKLAKSNKKIHVDKDQSILDALLSKEIAIPYSCKTGQCKSCVVRVLEGEVLHKDNCLSETERSQQKLMCPCVSRSQGDYLVIDV